MDTNSMFKQIAAKSDPDNRDKWLPFYVHSLDTKGMIQKLCQKWLPEPVKFAMIDTKRNCALSDDELEAICAFLGLVHDIGKITAAFQWKIGPCVPDYLTRLLDKGYDVSKASKCEGVPHARASEAILQSCGVPGCFAIIAGSHHGKPQENGFDWERELTLVDRECAYFGGHSGADKQKWEFLWRKWVHEALEFSGFSDLRDLPELDMESQMLLSGLLIAADWIASNDTYYPLIDLDETLSEEEIFERTETAWSKLKLPEPWRVIQGSFDFEQRFGFQPRHMQRVMTEIVENSAKPGIFILEAPMGGGKTEAALAAAELLAGKGNGAGVFFGLPTQATSNGIFSRLLPWAERMAEDQYACYAMKLAHGNAELNEDYQQIVEGTAQIDEDDAGLIVHEWFQGRKKALLSTFVVGTVDQMLMASLKQKHLMLRHLGLAGKVVIIDECHAYDAYMSQYLDRTLSWLGAYRTPVILLSATLPSQRRAELVDAYCNRKAPADAQEVWRTSRSYPLLTWTDGGEVRSQALEGESGSKKVAVETLSEEEMAAFLCEQLRDGGCAGIIVNTVRKAQETYESLQILLEYGFEIQLFHSQFLMPDRAKREAELMNRVGKSSGKQARDRLIVIGTQVLEQSLDLDFDLMLSQLCPMDLLLQRMGRLHRHAAHDAIRPDRLKEPRFMVLQTEDGMIDRGTQAVYGDWLLLRTQKRLPDIVCLPGDIPELVQDVYAEPGEELDETTKAFYEKYLAEIRRKERDADKYCLIEPKRKMRTERKRSRRNVQIKVPSPMHGLLDTAVGAQDAQAQAKVRDSDYSIDVLVMVEYNNRKLSFASCQEEEKTMLSPDDPLDWTMELKVAGQKLRLPRRFCAPYQASGRSMYIDDTIRALTKMSQRVAVWIQSNAMLRGELFLLLDEEYSAKIGDISIRYDSNLGLLVEE